MNCNEYENRITEYLEDTASPSQRIRMEQHLTECGKCRALAEQERSVINQLSEISIQPCPDEIIDRVMASISSPSMSLRQRIRSWLTPECPMRYGVASLAGAFAVVMLLLLLHLPGQQRPTMDGHEYRPEEIQQAAVEARLAIAYFAVYSRKAETVFEKIDVLEPVITPIEGEFKKTLGKIPYI